METYRDFWRTWWIIWRVNLLQFFSRVPCLLLLHLPCLLASSATGATNRMWIWYFLLHVPTSIWADVFVWWWWGIYVTAWWLYAHLGNSTKKKESLFYLTKPLEHIDFHVISYWTSNIWSLWRFRENLLSPHRQLFLISSKGSFICTFPTYRI